MLGSSIQMATGWGTVPAFTLGGTVSLNGQAFDTGEAQIDELLLNAIAVMGVEYDQSTDTWTRIDMNGSAISYTPDFDNLSPWKDIVRVTLATTGLVNTFDDNGAGSNLTKDGTDGRVMVRIPRFYVKSTNPSANKYRFWISPIPRSGFELHPAFNQRGRGAFGGADFIYAGAYEADLEYDGTNKVLHSRSGVQPLTGNADCIWEVDFDAGANEPAIGDSLSTPTEGGFLVVDYHVSSGTWGGNNAAGKLWIRKPGDTTVGWTDNETITNDTQTNTLAVCEFTGGSKTGETADIGTCRTYAGNIGTGWGITGIWSLSAIKLLYYIEMAGADSQTDVGRGIVDKGGGTGFNGELTAADSIDSQLGTNGTGSGNGTDGYTPIAYRGIENLWGNTWNFVDGYNAVDAEYRIINRDGSGTFADALAGGDYEASVATPITSNGYIDNIEWEDLLKFLLIPSSTSGASNSHFYDYFYAHDAGETNILLAGGSWRHGARAGVAFLYSNYVATYRDRTIGARLEFID